MHSGLLSLYLTNAPGLYCYLQSKLVFKDRIAFLPWFLLPSRKIGRSGVIEWHYIVNNSGMHLLILPVPLILSMYILNNEQY